MYKAKHTRIYPTNEQKALIDKTIGCCRKVYNYALFRKEFAYQNEGIKLSQFDLMKELLPLKEEFPYLKEVDATSLQQSIRDLDKAYNMYFKGVCEKPKPHKKHHPKQSYRTTTCKIKQKHHLYLSKIGLVKTSEKLNKKKRVVSATVSKHANRYYISILYEYVAPKLNKEDRKVGLDLGIRNFVVLSDGTKYENSRSLKRSEARLKRLQQSVSRKQKGSKNRHKAVLKLAKCHNDISNKRKDHLHKISTAITKQYSFVAIETLEVKKMQDNHYVAKGLIDVSFAEFVRQLEYKGEWYNCKIVKVDKDFPSTQKCNVCGYINDKVKSLAVRKWTCPKCNSHHDRDLNASINILNKALVDYEGVPVEVTSNLLV